MASASPLAGLPKDTFPVHLSAAFQDALHPEQNQGKKRKRDTEEMIAMRYNFKPNSLTPSTPGVYTAEGGSKRVSFDVGGGVKQVFEAQEETSRVRDCVILWDPAEKAFTLHPLSATYQLTLSRGLSGPSKPPPPASVSSATSSGSSGAPLARRKSKTGPTPAAASGAAASAAVQTPPKQKKSKPEDLTPSTQIVTPTPRSTKGGKSLPRKTISTPTFANTPTVTSPVPIPTPSAPPKAKAKAAAKPKAVAPAKSAGKGAAKGGKGKKAAASASTTKKATGGAGGKGKFKSAEIIDDDDDVGADGESLDDEFARMLGENIAAAQPAQSAPARYYEEDDDDDEESEDDELGGARLVGGSGMDGDSEWL